jgi:hypothetical protein
VLISTRAGAVPKHRGAGLAYALLAASEAPYLAKFTPAGRFQHDIYGIARRRRTNEQVGGTTAPSCPLAARDNFADMR